MAAAARGRARQQQQPPRQQQGAHDFDPQNDDYLPVDPALFEAPPVAMQEGSYRCVR